MYQLSYQQFLRVRLDFSGQGRTTEALKRFIRLKSTFDKKYGHGFQSRSDKRSSIRWNHHVHEFLLRER